MTWQVVSFLALACLVLSVGPASADRKSGRNIRDDTPKPPFTGGSHAGGEADLATVRDQDFTGGHHVVHDVLQPDA